MPRLVDIMTEVLCVWYVLRLVLWCASSSGWELRDRNDCNCPMVSGSGRVALSQLSLTGISANRTEHSWLVKSVGAGKSWVLSTPPPVLVQVRKRKRRPPAQEAREGSYCIKYSGWSESFSNLLASSCMLSFIFKIAADSVWSCKESDL